MKYSKLEDNGVNVIRRLRIHTFRKKNWSLINATKILAIILLSTVGFIYLTGNTGAYFNDTTSTTGILTAGFWETISEEWDKSSLEFTEKESVIESCGPTKIVTTIKNTGSNMNGSTEYFVFYNKNGNPKDGEKVGEGIINPIESNQTGTIEFNASLEGNYKFKALQRPGHGNKDDVRHELWSETITLKCDESSTNDKNQDTSEEAEKLNESDATEVDSTQKDSELEAEREVVEETEVEPGAPQDPGTGEKSGEDGEKEKNVNAVQEKAAIDQPENSDVENSDSE
jgi:TasA anchoring/assembly protein